MDDLNEIKDTQNAYSSIAMRNGVIAAMAMIAIGLVFNLTGLVDPADNSNPGNIVSSIINWIVIIGAMVMTVKTHRDDDFGDSFLLEGHMQPPF